MRALYALVLLPILMAPVSAEPLFDLVILADESGSMGSGGFQSEKDFAVQVAQGLTFGPTDTAASFLLYGAAPRVVLELTANKSSYINSVNSVQYAQASDTDMATGLALAQNQFTTLGRAGAHKILALLGDGKPDLNNDGIVPKLNELAAAGVHVFSLVGGVDPNPAFMESLLRNDGQSFELDTNPAALFIDAIDAIAASTLFGDYNGNGVVDAADYALWRDGGPLQNEGATIGTVDAADYDFWRARFGTTLATGAGDAVAIPEPATSILLFIAAWVTIVTLAADRRLRTRATAQRSIRFEKPVD